jgi:Protein of unknown function (DUF2892)
MESNVGGTDSLVRLMAGAVLMALACIDVLGDWAWLGAVLGATGLFRFCPFYAAVGLSSGGRLHNTPQGWER